MNIMKAFMFFLTYFIYLIKKHNSQTNNTVCLNESLADYSYKQRINMTIIEAVNFARKCIQENNYAHCSIWIAGACFVDAQNKTNIEMGLKIAAMFLKPFLAKLFEGGNDGWPSYATTDIYLRYRDIISKAKTTYEINPPFDQNIVEFKSLNTTAKNLTLNEMFRIVITNSGYRMIDSTSNHETMNSVARYLAEQAFPGKVLRGFNNKVGDTGEASILRRCKGIIQSGIGEYGSPNYGVMNFAPYLSVYQFTQKNHPNYANITSFALKAYKAALQQLGAFWFKGNLAMSCGRGYPNTYAYGAGEGMLLPWIYFGGSFPYDVPGNNTILSFGWNIKSMGILPSIAYYSGLAIDPYILQLGQCEGNRYSKSYFGLNHQSSYITKDYAHYSESRKNGGRIWQISWSSRIVFSIKNKTIEKMSPVVFITQPNACVHLDRVKLNASELYGSGSYGQGNREENLQSLDSVFHIYNINNDNSTQFDPRNARGAIIYVPVPTVFVKKVTWRFNEYKGVKNGEGFIYPVFLDDSRKMFFGYDSVFIAVISNTAITLGTVFNDKLCIKHGWSLIYNVYGDNSTVPLPTNKTTQFAIGVETTSPQNFSGKNLLEKFENFVKVYSKIPIPKKVYSDTDHPVFQYVNARGEIMTTQFASRYDSKYLYKDWIGKEWNTTKTLVDYSKWPFLSSQLYNNGKPGDYLINYGRNQKMEKNVNSLVFLSDVDKNSQSDDRFEVFSSETE